MRILLAGGMLAWMLLARVRVQVRLHSIRKPGAEVKIAYLGFIFAPKVQEKRKKMTPWYEALSSSQRDTMIAALPAAKGLFRRIRLETLFLRVQTPDAANAALWYGSMTAARSLMCQCCPKTRVRLRCCCAPIHDMRLTGILSLRMGQIMGAALHFGAIYAKRRLFSWINTRLKAL